MEGGWYRHTARKGVMFNLLAPILSELSSAWRLLACCISASSFDKEKSAHTVPSQSNRAEEVALVAGM